MSFIIRSDLTNLLETIQIYFPAYEYCFYRLRAVECICLADDDTDQNCAFCEESTLCQECFDNKPTTRDIITNLLSKLYLRHGFDALCKVGNPYDIVIIKLCGDNIYEYSEGGFVAKIVFTWFRLHSSIAFKS